MYLYSAYKSKVVIVGTVCSREFERTLRIVGFLAVLSVSTWVVC